VFGASLQKGMIRKYEETLVMYRDATVCFSEA